MPELASKGKTMAETQNNLEQEQVMMTNISQKNMRRRSRRGCVIGIGVVLLLLMMLVIVLVILAFTLFKPKEATAKLVSATLEGIAPRVTLPAIDIQLNVTLDLNILVENPNRASFKHEQGNSVLLYKGNKVGETDIYPGFIPAKGSANLSSRLTLQADELASNLTTLIGDLLGGQLSIDTVTKIPGKVSFLGIIKKHIVANSYCQFTIGIPDFKILSQICKTKTKL